MSKRSYVTMKGVGAQRKTYPKKRRQLATVPYAETAAYRVNRNPRMDLKVWLHAGGGGVSSTPGTMVALNGANNMSTLARGLLPVNNFEGRSIIPVSIEARFYIVGGFTTSSTATPEISNTMRIILFQWLDDSTPTVTGTPLTDLLEPMTTPNTGQQCLAPISSQNRSSVSVLMDKMITTNLTQVALNPLTAAFSESSSTCRSYKKYIKGAKCCPIEFNSGSTLYQKGGIYLALLSDSSVAPNPGISWFIKVNFLE